MNNTLLNVTSAMMLASVAMPVVADTTAMGTPHEIDYTLYLDSTTLQPAALED